MIRVNYQWENKENGIKVFKHEISLTSEDVNKEVIEGNTTFGIKTFSEYSKAKVWISIQQAAQVFHVQPVN